MKRLVTLALAAALAVGMSLPTFAAGKAVDFEKGVVLSDGYSGNAAAAGDTIDYGDIYASDEIEDKLNLRGDMFVDADGKPVGSKTKNLTSSEIRNAKIAMRSQIKGGSKVFSDISLNNGKGYINIDFVDEWVSTKTEDFEAFIYLTIDGKRYDDQAVTLTGTFGNKEVDVYSDYDYIDLSYGDVAIAGDFVSKIEVDLGNGVSIFTKLFKDKKYYGTASRDADEADDVVFSKYPDVDNVVTLKTVGLNSTGDIVKLDTDHAEYFVYDKDMNYLGKSSDMLPYSTKYYLANQKLDVENEEEATEEEEEPTEEEEEPTEEEDDDDETTGGSTGGNVNTNPDTGVNGMLNVAVVAAVVSLAAVGAVIARRK